MWPYHDAWSSDYRCDADRKTDTNKTALAAMELASFISAEILLSPLEQSIPCARSDHPQPKAQGPIILHTSDNGVGVSGDRTALNQGFRCSFCSHIYMYLHKGSLFDPPTGCQHVASRGQYMVHLKPAEPQLLAPRVDTEEGCRPRT